MGVAKGDNRIIEAVRVAVNSPLLETTIEGARGVILNVVGGDDLTFDEVADAAELVFIGVLFATTVLILSLGMTIRVSTYFFKFSRQYIGKSENKSDRCRRSG